MGGRAPPSQNTLTPGAGSRWLGAVRGSLAQRPDPVVLLAGRASAKALIALCLSYPTAKRLGRAAHLCRDRAHRRDCDACSLWCSKTIRTARSRTSGENLFVVFVWLHTLKSGSLRQTRSGSAYLAVDKTCGDQAPARRNQGIACLSCRHRPESFSPVCPGSQFTASPVAKTSGSFTEAGPP